LQNGVQEVDEKGLVLFAAEDMLEGVINLRIDAWNHDPAVFFGDRDTCL